MLGKLHHVLPQDYSDQWAPDFKSYDKEPIYRYVILNIFSRKSSELHFWSKRLLIDINKNVLIEVYLKPFLDKKNK